MTGGRVVVLGRTGRNFAAGMSGGIAYVLDATGTFARRCNREMVDLEPLDRAEDIELVRELIERHVQLHRQRRSPRACSTTGPRRAALFVKVMPRDYKRVLDGAGAGRGRRPRRRQFAELVGVASNG